VSRNSGCAELVGPPGHVDANLVAGASYAAFEDVANAELTADLLNIDAKYSCSGSFDRLSKGKTTIDNRGRAGDCEIEAGAFDDSDLANQSARNV
jgi:hypothetical protein